MIRRPDRDVERHQRAWQVQVVHGANCTSHHPGFAVLRLQYAFSTVPVHECMPGPNAGAVDE